MTTETQAGREEKFLELQGTKGELPLKYLQGRNSATFAKLIPKR